MSSSNALLWPRPPVIGGYGIAVLSVTPALMISRWPALHLQDAPDRRQGPENNTERNLDTSSIVVETKLHNYGGAPATFTLSHKIHAWKSASVVARSRGQKLSLEPGEDRTITEPFAFLTRSSGPEDPNLYVLETSTGGDSTSIRFGMRALRFDTPTKRAYLNGRVYFMRGSNITLHRFFEDPKSGALPWDEQWVRKLLVEIPKEMHWNSFRFCIGPVPDKWLDIADEAGLLIENEYFVWTGQNWHGPENQVKLNADEMIQEYSEWVRDNANHPSVVV